MLFYQLLRSTAVILVLIKIFYSHSFVRCSLNVPLLGLSNFIRIVTDQVSMETMRMILARFIEFDVGPTNALPWQPDVRFQKKSQFVEKFA